MELRVATDENIDCFLLRPLTPDDEPFLWEMLYHAIYVPAGEAAPSREVVLEPELARYVGGWGRAGDCGVLATVEPLGTPVGAVWLRLLVGDDRGYGYVNDGTPELSIAVLPEYRGQGVGTRLLRELLASEAGQFPLSLSVSPDNPARRLYEQFGFTIVREDGDSLVMKRG